MGGEVGATTRKRHSKDRIKGKGTYLANAIFGHFGILESKLLGDLVPTNGAGNPRLASGSAGAQNRHDDLGITSCDVDASFRRGAFGFGSSSGFLGRHSC